MDNAEHCGACGRALTEDDRSDLGIAMYEGEIVANNDTGPWGGHPCCPECFEKHERGELKTRPLWVWPDDNFVGAC
ncbi:MAG: hypothetical protein IT435_05520 [Phycisphaerales bacterium]|nr:hypothetical protein [Phycisphaerales bacterium]